MARWYLKSSRSVSGRLLVTRRSRLWSWMTDSYPFRLLSIGPPFLEIQLFQNLTLKIYGQCHACGQSYSKFDNEKNYGQGHDQGQNWWLHLRPSIHSIFDLVQIRWSHLGPDYIWVVEFNRYVCFPFCGNRTIFGWDITNSILDLETSRSWAKSIKI